MSWLSDRWRDVKRAAGSDEARIALGLGLGGYGIFGKAAMNKFLTSSMLKNMAKRYATSYLTSTAMGKPHAGRGAMSSALWSLPFQAWKNYQLTQPFLGGESGTEFIEDVGMSKGTDVPWWRLMTGQVPKHGGVMEKGIPQLNFMDMFTKKVPTYGGGATGNAILDALDALGMGAKGDITGYKDKFDWLGLAPEVIGHAQAGWKPEELEEQGAERTRRQQALMDEIMQNPLYGDENMYRWPGWGLTAGVKRGGIMQALQGGGDFMQDLMMQEEAPMAGEAVGPVDMPDEGIQAYSDFPEATSEMFAGDEGIPPEILEGIVNQRDPLMEKIMEIIMRMIAPTLGEDEEMPMMGPSGMGEMGDYIGPMSEIGEEEQGDLGLGMQSGGDYTRGAHVMGPGTGTSDSVNAKLSDGEFVMTANAVKNAGGGDRREGAKRMYQMMNRLDPQSARPGEEPTVV